MGGSRLIGRDVEVAAVERVLDGASARAAALSIIAAPGTGKSAVLEFAAARAAGRGWPVLRCTGVEAEATLAYSSLTDLLLPVREELRGWLPAPQRRALDVVMLQDEPGAESVEPHAVARACAEALRVLSGRAPLVLLVDDLHWLDADSARALAFAIRRLGEQHLAIVTAAREQAPGDQEVMTALRELGERHTVRTLAPLSPGDIELLLEGHDLSLPRASLRYVQDTAAGHPLYALELARHVAEVGRGAVPNSLAGLLAERLRRLPPDALPVLAAAAQMSAPTRVLIGDALAVAPTAVDTALDAAIDARIVVDDGGRIRFTHPLFAEAATATATSAWRREIHRRLADVVGDAEQRAVHLSLAHSQPDESIAAAIEAGATRARTRGAPEIAAELITAALRLTPADETEALGRRRVDGAYHNVAAGRPDAAVALMLAALADERDRERRADLEWRAAMMHFLAGELGPCIELLEAGRAHASDPSLRAQISTRLASMYCWVNDFPRSVQVAETIDIDRLDGVYRSNALSVICVANFGAGRSAAPDPWQIVADFEQLHPAPPAHEHPVIRLMVMLTLHDAAEVARVAGCALERAVADADDVGIAWLAATMAHAELRAGRWEVAARAADDSLRAGRRAGSAPALVFGLGAAATVCAYRAEVDAAARYAAELVAIGDGQPLLCCLEHGQLVLGFLALSRGDASTARAEYLRACQALDRGLPIQPALPALRWHLIDVLIDAGDVGEAGRRIEELAALADHPLAAAVAATGRGRIAAQQGDRDGADAAFGEALLAHDRLRWPFERAVTLYRQGCALRDQRRRTLARQALGEAEQLFAGLGSPLWAARAGDALAGISGRAPSAPDALTPTEDEVANLAASGLTNQEIADRMFISAKTVATHLSHVYAKLHVRSRTELAACLPHRSG